MSSVLEKAARTINEALKELPVGSFTFRLSAPEKLTIRTASKAVSAHGYRKQGFIGDEEFVLREAYLGKSGKLICVLDQSGDEQSAAEIPYSECAKKLLGFSNFELLVSSLEDDKDMKIARIEADEIECVAHVDATRDRFIENSTFGTW